MAYIKTTKFSEIFTSMTDLSTGWKYSMFNLQLSTGQMKTDLENYSFLLYTLLSSRYGSSYISDISVDSFKNKLFAIYFQYGPRWIKQLDIQNKVYNLTDAELMSGAITKSTHGYNPSTVPGTANDDTSIETVNDQSLVKYTKSKLEAYANQLNLLDDGITEEFMNRFAKLFMTTIDIDDVLEVLEDDD